VEYREVLKESWGVRRGGLASRAQTDDRSAILRSEVGRPVVQTRRGPLQRLRRQLLARLLRDIELEGYSDLESPSRVREQVSRQVDEAVSHHEVASLSPEERAYVIEELVADICGLGPVDALFADPTVSDILVNGPFEVWVDRFGRLERTGARFDDEQHLMRLLDRLVASHGRHLDEGSPYVDVRLADGSRLHAVIPPLAVAPVMSIRRSRAVPFRIAELFDCGTLSAEMGEFLAAAVRARLNLLISGGAASGKTTFLNVLSGFIPEGERVITIEETAELRLAHPHVVSLEARLPNIEGRGEVTLRALVKNALRMRADRIIVGEVRGGEVFDMLQAMNVGHEGSLTTVHANSPEDALRRLENLVLMGGFELPSRAIREMLAAALHVIVQMTRFPDGTRRITSLREVVFEEDRLATREIFRFDVRRGERLGEIEGEHVATGERPHFLSRLRRAGYEPAISDSPRTATPSPEPLASEPDPAAPARPTRPANPFLE
jgi:pilus assembly protein CpaF